MASPSSREVPQKFGELRTYVAGFCGSKPWYIGEHQNNLADVCPWSDGIIFIVFIGFNLLPSWLADGYWGVMPCPHVPVSPCPLIPISLAELQDQTAVQPTFHDIRTSLLGVFLNESVSGDHLSRHIPIIPIIVGFTSTILVDGKLQFHPTCGFDDFRPGGQYGKLSLGALLKSASMSRQGLRAAGERICKGKSTVEMAQKLGSPRSGTLNFDFDII